MTLSPSSKDAKVPSSLPVSRIDAASHLVKPHQIRESLAVNGRFNDRNSLLIGIQAALASSLTLILGLVSPWPHLAGSQPLGRLPCCSAVSRRWEKGGAVLTCAAWLVLAVVSMSVAARLGAPLPLRLGSSPSPAVSSSS